MVVGRKLRYITALFILERCKGHGAVTHHGGGAGREAD